MIRCLFFGTKLRQQIFTVQDFALNQLNKPTPIGNYASRFFGQWSLFDSTQSWKALDRAKYLIFAASEQLQRTDQELIYQTVQAYYTVLLAQKQVQVAEEAVKTVTAIEQQSHERVESGLAVDSDLLSAQVQASARQQELIERRNELALARTRLALAMGAAADALYQPREALEGWTLPAADLNQLEKTALEKRPDLKRSEWERSAQDKNVGMSKAAFGPRLNAFGSWQEDSHSVGWTSANNWVAGAELQFTLTKRGVLRKLRDGAMPKIVDLKLGDHGRRPETHQQTGAEPCSHVRLEAKRSGGPCRKYKTAGYEISRDTNSAFMSTRPV